MTATTEVSEGNDVKGVMMDFTTGCSVLFEAEVLPDWLTTIREGIGSEGWSKGPIEFMNRQVNPVPFTKEDRSRRLGPGIAQHVLGEGRRFHKQVSHRVCSNTEGGDPREFKIIAFELIVGDVTEISVSTPDASDAPSHPRTPVVVAVHIDPPGSTSTSDISQSELRFEHVSNLLSRFFKYGLSGNGRLLEKLIVSRNTSHVVEFESTKFVLIGESRTADLASSDNNPNRPVSLITSDARRSAGSIPIYSMLTDVAPCVDEDKKRWDADREFFDGNGRGRKVKLPQCGLAERRGRRSRVLAELEVRPWAHLAMDDVLGVQGSGQGLRWKDWDIVFSRSGAGFAHAADPSSPRTARQRDDLSTVYVDIVALEMLKDRTIQRFSELTRDLASGIGHEPDRRAKCVEAWKELVKFTSVYFGRSDGLELRDREFLDAFQDGAGVNLERDISRVHANLERLAQVSRMEIDQDVSTREQKRLARERKFDMLVGIIATIFIPLTVVPPILAWFSPQPAALPAVIGGAVAVFVALLIAGSFVFQLCWSRTDSEDKTGESPRTKQSEHG